MRSLSLFSKTVLVMSTIQFIQPLLPWLLDDVICCSPWLPVLHNKTYFICDDNATPNRYFFHIFFLSFINCFCSPTSYYFISSLNLSYDRIPWMRIQCSHDKIKLSKFVHYLFNSFELISRILLFDSFFFYYTFNLILNLHILIFLRLKPRLIFPWLFVLS